MNRSAYIKVNRQEQEEEPAGKRIVQGTLDLIRFYGGGLKTPTPHQPPNPNLALYC